MTGAEWHIRLGSPSDRELLASFACADPAVRWQAEVEQFIQTQLADWAFDPRHGLTEEIAALTPATEGSSLPVRSGKAAAVILLGISG